MAFRDRALLICACSLVAIPGSSLPPLVSTTCGPVAGTTHANPDGSEVYVYKSIPYAAPPLGALRWQAPQPNACWNGTYPATRFRSVCVQEEGLLGEEDCLFVDVHVPANLTAPAPVVFYIHGGSLVLGAGQWEYVDVLAVRLDAVVVTVQYRLGVLGWLCIEGMASCNWGLLDQQAAMRWTRDNIAAFGGDPGLVTLAGQSSGGTSIFAHLSTPSSRGLFSGAISMSGSPNISISLTAAHEQNAGVAGVAGCAPPGSTPAERLACLRALPADAVARAMPASWNTPGLWSLAGLTPAGRGFAGLPVVDGGVIAQPFGSALAAGLVDVPLIIGNMGQECDLAPGQDVEHYSLAEWHGLLESTLAPWGNVSFTDAVWASYLNDSLISSQRGYDCVNTDYGIGCANAQLTLAAKEGGAFKSPIYTYVGEWPQSHPKRLPGGYNITAAYHTWDWSAVCEYWPFSVVVPGPTDVEFARGLQAVWREFLRVRRISSFGWKTVDAVPGFPAHYGTFVWGTPSLPPFMASEFRTDFRASTCALLASQGFDARFWWCN